MSERIWKSLICWMAVLGPMIWNALGCRTSETGRMPDHTVAPFARTKGSGYRVSKVGESGYELCHCVQLELTDKVPMGAYVEARFENPVDPNNPLVVGRRLTEADRSVLLQSPPLAQAKERDYGVEILIYSDEEKTKQLGHHSQQSRCRVDMDRDKTFMEVFRRLAVKH